MTGIINEGQRGGWIGIVKCEQYFSLFTFQKRETLRKNDLESHAGLFGFENSTKRIIQVI